MKIEFYSYLAIKLFSPSNKDADIDHVVSIIPTNFSPFQPFCLPLDKLTRIPNACNILAKHFSNTLIIQNHEK